MKTSGLLDRLQISITLAAAALVVGCATTGAPEAPEEETLLLVSMPDGTIIEQTIEVDADVCLKQIEDSRTTCYARGEPIYDGAGSAIIGYRMERKQIQLVPKSERPQTL